MSLPLKPDVELEHRMACARLLNLLIRAGIILAITLMCFRFAAPFLTLLGLTGSHDLSTRQSLARRDRRQARASPQRYFILSSASCQPGDF